MPRWAMPRRRRSPILWSHGIASEILRVEQHDQPANGSSECYLSNVLWNTVYLENAINWLKSQDVMVPEEYS
ncbi:hypothetical protein GS682_21545 [Nostoc sp. B(2019)]|nr:hypothetical protein [Nostoc sp. B(2019)]